MTDASFTDTDTVSRNNISADSINTAAALPENAPTVEMIRAAARRIAPRILTTPLVFSPTLSRAVDAEVYLKLENLQKTGSFKIRGATNKIMVSASRIGPKGVVAASAGNHAQGVALAAGKSNIPALILMPEGSSISKQEAVRGYGGSVRLYGSTVGDCLEEAERKSSEGRFFLHPFDDPDIIAGQGGIGLEIIESLPDADMIISPVGGGGLISGVATAAMSMRPGIRIIGAQAAACPSSVLSFAAGRRQTCNPSPTIADGIAVPRPGRLNFGIMKKLVSEIVEVDDSAIADAILLLLERKKTLAEGAGAASLAALLSGRLSLSGCRKIVVIISGGNVDSPLLDRIIRKGMNAAGRVLRLSMILPDRPGALSSLLRSIADLGANVLDIRHNRNYRGLSIYESAVTLELETRGREHIRTILESLRSEGRLVQTTETRDTST